jgi:hypothetical protein
MTRITIVIAAGLAFSATFSAVPAHAQRARVFVASYGNDGNPCTFGSPCKTFQQAVTVVAAGGEVTAIDSAGFQPVNITQSVTITSPAGVEAGIAASPGADAIDINAPGATVVLRGLTLNGANSASTGIYSASAARVEIIDCAVRNFASAGITIQSPAQTSVVISNTIVSDNFSEFTYGIYLSSGGASMIATLDQITVTNNYYGINVQATDGTVEVLISNSHIDNNVNTGLFAQGGGYGTIGNVVLRNVTLNQTPNAVYLNGFASVWFSQVTSPAVPGITSNGVSFVNSGNVASSDGSNHLGSIIGGSIGLWGFQ